MKQQQTKLKPQAKYLIGILLLVILVYVVVPQLGIFKQTPSILKQSEPTQVMLAVLFSALTYFAAAGTYYFLAFKKLPYFISVIVQYGAMFLNRLLPAGIGTMGANFFFLKNRRHTDAQATAVIGVNNLLSFIGNSLIILFCVLLLPSTIQSDSRSINLNQILLIGLIIGLVILFAAALFGRKKLKRFTSEVLKSLLNYRSRPGRVALALGTASLLTIFNSLSFMFSLNALGIDLSFAAVVIILSFGVGTGAATPTPGGLGGFEAGLAAGLVVYGIDKPTALAAALLYRLVSYWLMLLFGALAFIYAQKQKLLFD